MEILEKLREDRRYRRVNVKFQVFSRDTGKLVGSAINLSPDGMLIETENSLLKPGTKILLEFKLNDQALPIKAYSDIRWIKAGSSESKPSVMGVQFINVYEADRRKVEEYVEEQITRINSDGLSLADFINVPDKDLFAKTRLFWDAMDDMTKKGFNTYGMPLRSASKNRVMILDEKTGKEREMIMMGTSNYLGLTVHPKVVNAVKEAIQKYGVGTGSVPLLSGTYDLHKKLEAKLAELKRCQDAVVFPTGHMANIGAISALLGKRDIAIIDKMVHLSILDGCMLSLGSFKTFRHSDTRHLRQVLESVDGRYAGKLVIVEGVHGIDGDIAPLPEIVEVAGQFGAKVMVDDAHATGVIGEMGRGTASHFKMEGRVDVVMDSLSKALGGLGGYIASGKEVINYLRFYARPSMFSVSSPPALAAAALAAVQVMESEPSLIKRLSENAGYMRENLRLLGFNNVEKSESAIISTIIGDELILRQMNKRILEEGVYLETMPYPTVPRGQERLRLRVMATHTKKDMDKALEALEKVGKEFGLLKKPPVSSTPFKTEQKAGGVFAEKKEIEVIEIFSKESIAESIKFSWEVYKNSPQWVPYFLIKDRTNLLSGDSLYFRENVKSKRFIVKENGETAAAVSAFVDQRFINCWNRRVGFLGFFEALPGRHAAVESLLEAAIEFLKAQDMEEVWAPVNIPFVFYGGGILLGGFDKTPSFLQPYTLPCYHDYFLKAGFGEVKHIHHYSINLSSPESAGRISALIRKSGVAIRELDKSEYDAEAVKILKIYNEAFPRLWKYASFRDDEFVEFARDFRDLVVQGLWLIAEVGGETAGFIGAFPQCPSLFRTMSGEVGVSELFRVSDELELVNEGAVVLLGVLDKYGGRGLGLELLAHVCANMIEKGYKKTTCTWEISDMKDDAGKMIERLGGEKDDFEWTIYGRSLA